MRHFALASPGGGGGRNSNSPPPTFSRRPSEAMGKGGAEVKVGSGVGGEKLGGGHQVREKEA